MAGSKLGSVEIFIPKGAVVRAIALLDLNNKPIGACPVKPVRPADGDWIQVELKEIPE